MLLLLLVPGVILLSFARRSAKLARLPEVVAAKSRKRIKDENQVESNNSQS